MAGQSYGPHTFCAQIITDCKIEHLNLQRFRNFLLAVDERRCHKYAGKILDKMTSDGKISCIKVCNSHPISC